MRKRSPAFVLLAFTVVLALAPAQAFAAITTGSVDGIAQSEKAQTIELATVKVVNPLYEDELDEQAVFDELDEIASANNPVDLTAGEAGSESSRSTADDALAITTQSAGGGTLALAPQSTNDEMAGDEAVSLESEYVSEDRAAQLIRDALANRIERFSVNVQTGDDYESLIASMFGSALEEDGCDMHGDYLRWSFGGYEAACRGSSQGGVYKLTYTYTVSYYVTHEQDAQLSAAIDNALDDILENGMSDLDKIQAVYDFICAHVSYDYARLNDDSTRLQYTAYAAMIENTSVCQGYSSLMYVMLRRAGVDVRMISGTSHGEGHAWNIVKVGDRYYNADTTWDRTSYENGQLYRYYLKNNADFEDHARDSSSEGDGIDYASEDGDFNKAYPMGEVSLYQHGKESGGGRIAGDGDQLPANDTKIGDIVYFVFNGKATALDYQGDGGALDIPAEITVGEGADAVVCPVVAIGDSFAYRAPASLRITAVTIPDSVTTVGFRAFAGCTSLASAALPAHLVFIGTQAFMSCSALTSVAVPSSVARIGSAAFSSCSSVSSLTVECVGAFLAEDAFESLGSKADALLVTAATAELANSLSAAGLDSEKVQVTVRCNHELQFCDEVAPTCLEEGTAAHWHCAICGGDFADESGSCMLSEGEMALAKTGHAWSEWKTVVEPTTTSTGLKRRTCTADACGAVEEQVIDKLPSVPIAKPVAKTGLIYTGAVQAGVLAGAGYALSGTVRATNAGTYKATATPKAGYAWSDGSSGQVSLTWTIRPKQVSPAVSLAATSYVYSGAVRTPAVTVKLGSTVLKNGTDYAVSYPGGRKNAGTYIVKVTLKGNYSGSKTTQFKIVKAANPIAVKAVARSAKASVLKKKAVTLARPLKFDKAAQGVTTYKKVSGNSKIRVNAKTGKLTVAKGLKKGAYKVKVRATAAGNANYKAKSVTTTVVVKVK